ncbi:unnamed protein product [Moneuplotes crassus]|uniref:Uncharacterized protein n=1 Tax=Euplotes crassus TaxID=5936 RepID=A0AAD1XAP2_EUPCR|nr:unnamed protein product [Moneuplotes crassus]
MLFLPLAIFCFITLMWGIILITHIDWIKDFKRDIVISIISILLLLHLALMQSGINAFRCVAIDRTLRAALIGTDIECYSSTHLK